ncbi:hypothetical protein, partial [Acidithiobacillus caldus]
AVQAPPPPPEPSGLPENTVLPPKLDSLQNAGPSGVAETRRAAPAAERSGATGEGQDKPMSLAERMMKQHKNLTAIHGVAEKILSPGEESKVGVQANGFGLKHSE